MLAGESGVCWKDTISKNIVELCQLSWMIVSDFLCSLLEEAPGFRPPVKPAKSIRLRDFLSCDHPEWEIGTCGCFQQGFCLLGSLAANENLSFEDTELPKPNLIAILSMARRSVYQRQSGAGVACTKALVSFGICFLPICFAAPRKGCTAKCNNKADYCPGIMPPPPVPPPVVLPVPVEHISTLNMTRLMQLFRAVSSASRTTPNFGIQMNEP